MLIRWNVICVMRSAKEALELAEHAKDFQECYLTRMKLLSDLLYWSINNYLQILSLKIRKTRLKSPEKKSNHALMLIHIKMPLV